MKVTLISGSHRNGSQSFKVTKFIADLIKQQQSFDEIELVNLAANPLPLWDEGIFDDSETWSELLTPLQATLSTSDAFVIVTPEWHGQVPAGLKNFFLLCSAKEVGHKPALLVSLSSVDGGATPIAELRMSSYKNNRICYIPEQLIIRNVETVLNANAEENNPEAHSYFKDRIDWTLSILQQYARAFRTIRASGVVFNDKFSNGM